MGLAPSPLPFFFRELPHSGRMLLTNVAGAYSVLDDRKELQAIAEGDCTGVSADLREELFAKSFLCEPSELKTRAQLLSKQLAWRMRRNLCRPSLFLVVPTLRCDHDCRYCQVSRVPASKPGYDLDEKRIADILAVIGEVSPPSLKIEFQGGEPLLAFDFIRRFVDAAEEKLEGKTVEYVICSALGPLDDSMLNWAKTRKLTFSVSLDGPASLHDANRPSRMLEPAANTYRGIRLIQDALGPDGVNCLATVTRASLSQPREIVRTYFELGLPSLFLRPISPFGFARRQIERMGYSAAEFVAFYREAFDEVVALNRDRRFVEETAMVHLAKILRPATSGYVDLQSPAGYALSALVFNYDGRVFGSDEARMLWEATKAPELVLGRVGQGASPAFDTQAAARLLADTFLCALPGCEDCAYQPYCGADPVYHLATQGDHIGDKARSFFCQLETQLFDLFFELLTSDSYARRTATAWLGH